MNLELQKIIEWLKCNKLSLTLSGLNLPLSSSSTTSRELLSQFSTCSRWRWFDVVWKLKENCHALVNQFHGNFRSKTLCCRKIKSVFRDVKWCFNASWGLKGLNIDKHTILSIRKCPVTTKHLKIDNEILKHVKDSKMLGVIIDEHLNWESHIKTIKCKLARELVYCVKLEKY